MNLLTLLEIGPVAKGVLLMLIFCNHVFGKMCYYCSNKISGVDAAYRGHLGHLQRIYFLPVENAAKIDECHMAVDEANLYSPVMGKVCSEDDECVTISPNVPGLNFTVRGCAQYTLKASYRSRSKVFADDDKNSRGVQCSLDTSDNLKLPEIHESQSDSELLEFIVCRCSGEFCNFYPQPDTVSGENREENAHNLDPSVVDGSGQGIEPSQESIKQKNTSAGAGPVHVGVGTALALSAVLYNFV